MNVNYKYFSWFKSFRSLEFESSLLVEGLATLPNGNTMEVYKLDDKLTTSVGQQLNWTADIIQQIVSSCWVNGVFVPCSARTHEGSALAYFSVYMSSRTSSLPLLYWVYYGVTGQAVVWCSHGRLLMMRGHATTGRWRLGSAPILSPATLALHCTSLLQTLAPDTPPAEELSAWCTATIVFQKPAYGATSINIS